MDILMMVYNKIREDPYLLQEVGNRIKFYEYPNTDADFLPSVVIEEVMAPLPGQYGDNNELTVKQLIHVEVWTKGNGGRTKRDNIAREIQRVLRQELGMGVNATMPPEWDKPTNVYRDARRYEGEFYL